MNTSPRPFYNSEPARIIRERLNALHQMRTAEQIGKEIGDRDGKVVRSFAEGALRVPIDKALPLARALEIDPALFLTLVFRCWGLEFDGIQLVNDPAPPNGSRTRN